MEGLTLRIIINYIKKLKCGFTRILKVVRVIIRDIKCGSKENIHYEVRKNMVENT